MLNKIIQYSLHNRLVVMIASIVLLLWGSYTAHKMEVDVFPDLNAPTVVVMTEAQGMAPEEVERMVTFPIETAVNGATDVRSVRSSSTTGFSVVWVQFDWGTNIYTARQIVSEKLSTLGDALPGNVGSPTLGPQSSILGEMMIFGLTSDTTSLQDLRTIADWTIRPRLLSTGGVAQVTVIGGDIKEYQILLEPARMKHYGITMDEVLAVVDNMNQNSTGGILYEYGNEYIVQGILATDNVEELGKGVVKTVDNIPVLLSDIATVQIGQKEPKLGLASEKGHPAVLITITKQPNSNTLELTDKLDKDIALGRANLFRHFPSIPFYREFNLQHTESPVRGGNLRDYRTLLLLDERTYHHYIAGSIALVITRGNSNLTRLGINHQHDEFGRTRHSHRILGR